MKIWYNDTFLEIQIFALASSIYVAKLCAIVIPRVNNTLGNTNAVLQMIFELQG